MFSIHYHTQNLPASSPAWSRGPNMQLDPYRRAVRCMGWRTDAASANDAGVMLELLRVSLISSVEVGWVVLWQRQWFLKWAKNPRLTQSVRTARYPISKSQQVTWKTIKPSSTKQMLLIRAGIDGTLGLIEWNIRMSQPTVRLVSGFFHTVYGTVGRLCAWKAWTWIGERVKRLKVGIVRVEECEWRGCERR